MTTFAWKKCCARVGKHVLISASACQYVVVKTCGFSEVIDLTLPVTNYSEIENEI
jgi:hypothetical protein